MALAEGDLFAGFTVLRLLGSGGMGEVYLVQHPRLPRLDALKILPANATSDEGYRERFNREADLAASLFHPHVVGLHDRGEDNGQLWISMDFIDGTDAARLLADQPEGLPLADVVEVVGAIANALDFAHGRGLLHRDVKPANILLTTASAEQRRIFLADFGIARHAEDISGLTATNATIGTVAYAAPEQLMGEPIAGTADQYALAATAYHLLTGAPPYVNSNPAVVISKHLTGPPPSLSERRPELAALDPVLLRALSKNPADRFATCQDFAAAMFHAATAVNEGGGAPATAPATAPPTAAPATTPAPVAASGWIAPDVTVSGPTSAPYYQPAQALYPPQPSRSKGRRIAALLVPITLALVLIAAGAFAAVATNVGARRADAGPPNWQPYVAAGRQGAINLTTVDYQTADADIQRILDNATGKFYDDFKNRSAPFVEVVRQAKSVSKGTVTGAGLESLDGDTAKVLVGITVETTNANEAPKDPRSWRMRMTVMRVGPDYKISDTEFVP